MIHRYPIKGKLSQKYSHSNGQKLLSFTYYVNEYNNKKFDKLLFPNFDKIIPFNITKDVNLGYLFHSYELNIVVLAFTGAYTNILWLPCLNFSQISCYHHIKIHRGFWDLYRKINQQIYKSLNEYNKENTQILITGISLGGALGTICSLDLHEQNISQDITNYSFGSPRILNTVGAKYYDSLNINSYRIVNECDILCNIPFAFNNYTHVDKVIYFKINNRGLIANHVDSYLEYYDINKI